LDKSFLASRVYYGVLNDYLSPQLHDSLRASIEKNVIEGIPTDLVEKILTFALDEALAMRFDEFREGKLEYLETQQTAVLKRLHNVLVGNQQLSLG
jgi:hypothetical protein